MKAWHALWLYGLSILCSGCALVEDAGRNFHVAMKTPVEAHREHTRNKEWAEAAWQTVCTSDPSQAHTEDYARGFKDGFAEYLFRGGDGEPPLVAPLRYRDIRYQNPAGYQAVEDWFAGYRYGASIAKDSGARRWITGPSALRTEPTEHMMHEGHPEGPIHIKDAPIVPTPVPIPRALPKGMPDAPRPTFEPVPSGAEKGPDAPPVDPEGEPVKVQFGLPQGEQANEVVRPMLGPLPEPEPVKVQFDRAIEVPDPTPEPAQLPLEKLMDTPPIAPGPSETTSTLPEPVRARIVQITTGPAARARITRVSETGPTVETPMLGAPTRARITTITGSPKD